MRTASAVSGLVETVCVTPAFRLRRLLIALRRAGLAANEHDALTLAQATAYAAILALFPALIVAAAVFGMLPGYLPFRSQLGVFFLRVLPSNVAPVLEGYFSVTHRSETAGALLGSLGISLFGATGVMSTMMEGFRRAHDLPVLDGTFWRRRWRALALVPLSLVPMTVTSGLVVFGNVLTRWLARDLPTELRPTFSMVTLLLRWATALAGSTAIIGVIYHMGTDLSVGVRTQLEPWVREPWMNLRRGPEGQTGSARLRAWRASLPGAALATLLWFVATLLFGFYVTRYANYTRVYGSLGAAMALLAWLYIIALCVLIGAEFNAQLARLEPWPGRRKEPWRQAGAETPKA